MVKKLTTKLFIERARQIHGDKFDYSITDYEGALLKVKFVCNTCGEIIIMIASNHINIRSSKGKACGCYNCFKKMHPILQSSTNDEFITKSKATHGDIYDYSNTKYIHSQQKVEIICSKHGIFIQRPSDHLDGAGCKKCAIIKMIEKQRKTNEIHPSIGGFTKKHFECKCNNYLFSPATGKKYRIVVKKLSIKLPDIFLFNFKN
jgi:hypothetical protein